MHRSVSDYPHKSIAWYGLSSNSKDFGSLYSIEFITFADKRVSIYICFFWFNSVIRLALIFRYEVFLLSNNWPSYGKCKTSTRRNERLLCMHLGRRSFTFTFIQSTCHTRKHEQRLDHIDCPKEFDSIKNTKQPRQKGYTRCQLFDIYVKYFSLLYARFSNFGIKLCIVRLNAWTPEPETITLQANPTQTFLTRFIHERLVPFKASYNNNSNNSCAICMHACMRSYQSVFDCLDIMYACVRRL